jgi:hypothetical protein
MTPIEDAQTRLQFSLNIRKLVEPVWIAERQAREDLLRWCLWQVGIASGALVLLGSAFEIVTAVDSAPATATYVTSLISFIGVIMVATWTYRWHFLLGQQRTYAEAQQVLLFASPPGNEGALGVADQERLLRSYNELQSFVASQRAVQDRVQRLMKRQDAILYCGLVSLLLTVLETALSKALR